MAGGFLDAFFDILVNRRSEPVLAESQGRSIHLMTAQRFKFDTTISLSEDYSEFIRSSLEDRKTRIILRLERDGF
jgi:hypothetical protein